MNGDDRRESRPQPIEIRLSRKKPNPCGHSLNYLGEVASSIVRRQKSELRTAGGRELLDLPVEHPVWEGIDPNICCVLDSHIGQLSLFEVRLHPYFALNQIDHFCSRSDQLAGEDLALPDRPIGRGRNLCVGQIHLGDDNSRLLRLYISFVNIIFCVQRLTLSLRRLKLTLAGRQSSLGACEIRFTSFNHAAELTLLSGGRLQLLVSCRLRVKQELLTMQLSQCAIKFR